MVAIGSCDYCGEFCQSLGVNAVEYLVSDVDEVELEPDDLEEIEDEDEDDREARLEDRREELREERAQEQLDELGGEHRALVRRRIECAERDGYDWFPGRHVGPWHDANGKRLDECENCADGTEMDLGDWDSSLDHSACLECWADIAGGGVLRKRRDPDSDVWTADRPRLTAPHASTERADRERFEAAFAAYLDKPLPIRWVPSPLGVVRALADAPGFDAEVDGPWSAWAADPALTQALEEGDFRSETLPRDMGGPIASAIAAALTEQDPGGAVGQRPGLVTQILADAGQFDDRPALLRALSAAGQPLGADEALVRLLGEACDLAGPLVVLPGEIVVSDRPLVLEFDDRGRLHRDDGPAIAYGDGIVVHAWHGTVVPGWVVEHPERIDATAIYWELNVEVRRVMVERFGAERLLREGGAELVHEDETGKLWRKTIGVVPNGTRSRDESIVMVEVSNSTPEPDGTTKTYFLRVPPLTRTAREAVAWTFGMRGDDYRPGVES